MTYFVLKSMNEIDAFSYGYGKENAKESVYKYDSLAATATVVNSDNELNLRDMLSMMKIFIIFL